MAVTVIRYIDGRGFNPYRPIQYSRCESKNGYTDKPKTDKPKTRQTQDRQTQDRQTQDTTNPRHDQPKTRQTQDTTDPRHDKPKTRHFSNKTRDTFQFCMYRYNKTELDLFKRRWKTKEFRSER